MCKTKTLASSKIKARADDLKTCKKDANPQINDTTKTYHCKNINLVHCWIRFWSKNIKPISSIDLIIFKHDVDTKPESSDSTKRVQSEGCNVDFSKFNFGSISDLKAPPRAQRGGRMNARGGKRFGGPKSEGMSKYDQSRHNGFRAKLEESTAQEESENALDLEIMELLNRAKNMGMDERENLASNKNFKKLIQDPTGLNRIYKDKYDESKRIYEDDFKTFSYHMMESINRKKDINRYEILKNNQIKVWHPVDKDDEYVDKVSVY